MPLNASDFGCAMRATRRRLPVNDGAEVGVVPGVTMVYHGWDPQVSYIASSTDLVHWDTPRFVVASANPPGRGWYPTIIGEAALTEPCSAGPFVSNANEQRQFDRRATSGSSG